MNVLEKAYWIAKGIGWDNVPRRLLYLIGRRSGALRLRLPAGTHYIPRKTRLLLDGDSKEKWRARSAHFFRLPQRSQLRELVPEALWEAEVGEECRQALAGNYRFFSHWSGELGWPPNFQLDPVNHIEWPSGVHWLHTARSGPPRNDIKLVWEASRLSLAYTLARHYRYTGNEQWAKAFWDLTDAWIEQNPLNLTVAWACGQEVAFRLMAILFGTFATLDSDAASEDRLRKITQLCHQSAQRIAGNINYAISQENNHSISEALGLWTVALLFPEFPESSKWLRIARHVLQREVERQIYSDGSYVQHSMVYHRVLLDDLSWIIALGRINGEQLSPEIVKKFGLAAQWLGQFIETESGRVPNYGANDGANVLPLSCSDYLDFRPSTQLAFQVAQLDCPIPVGTWSEKSLWIGGELPADVPQENAPKWQAPIGGYHLLRGPQTMLMTRATDFQDRPSQCDLLHVDFWYKSQNILRDAGSFRYYHEDHAAKSYFYSTEAHNTASIPGHEQMEKGPSFLWLKWPKATAMLEGDNRLICRAHFHAGVKYVHERVVERQNDEYRIIDTLWQNAGGATYTIGWRLAPDWDWKFVDKGVLLGKHLDDELYLSVQGDHIQRISLTTCWESLYYGVRSPCPQLQIEAAQDVTTVISPEKPEQE